MTRPILLCLALTATSALAQVPRTASLDWMTGSWTQSKGDEIVSETWLGPGNGLMVAVNLTVSANDERVRRANLLAEEAAHAAETARAARE